MVPNTFSGVGSLSGLGSFTAALITNGYFATGSLNSTNTVIDKFDMQTETGGALTTTFPPGGFRYGMASHTNVGSAGYTAGGRQNVPINFTAAQYKMTFLAETASTLGSTLSVTTAMLSGLSNSGTAGYFGGGLNSSSSALATMYKFLYSSETSSVMASSLGQARYGQNAFSNQGIQGYFYSGQNSFGQSPMSGYILNYSTDAISSDPSEWGYIAAAATTANAGVKGYMYGGSSGTNPYSSTGIREIIQTNFSNSAKSRVSGQNLSIDTHGARGVYRSGSYGFVNVGNPFGSSTAVNKLPYSSETISVSSYSTSVHHDLHANFSNASA